jgi:hypothetical protein
MRYNRSAAVAVLGLVGALGSFPSSQAQAQVTPSAQAPKPLGQPCNLMSDSQSAKSEAGFTAAPHSGRRNNQEFDSEFRSPVPGDRKHRGP